MTPERIALVRESFAKVRPIADDAAALFYGRLFQIAPEVRPLFPADLTEQGRKLMTTLAVVVNSLDDLPALLPVVQRLGARHAGYGVTGSTSRRSARRCCGRWRRGWARVSRPRSAWPGPRPITCSPR